jgi:hypothetical protein
MCEKHGSYRQPVIMPYLRSWRLVAGIKLVVFLVKIETLPKGYTGSSCDMPSYKPIVTSMQS